MFWLLQGISWNQYGSTGAQFQIGNHLIRLPSTIISLLMFRDWNSIWKCSRYIYPLSVEYNKWKTLGCGSVSSPALTKWRVYAKVGIDRISGLSGIRHSSKSSIFFEFINLSFFRFFRDLKFDILSRISGILGYGSVSTRPEWDENVL